MADAIPNFRALTGENDLAAILESRWKEVESCVKSGAHLAAVILMGSILEGVLWSMAKQNEPPALRANKAPRDKKTDKVKPINDWRLCDLIEVVVELKWIGWDVQKSGHAVREYRNFVHPKEALDQMAKGDTPDADTCKICWQVVQAAINDVAKVKGIAAL